jgi:GWxTD domain-containing protein
MIDRRLRLALLAGAVVFSAACASSRVETKLDPESRDFISKVRYIITSEERRTFLALPAGAREEFIEDFWKRRDPTPVTEENEYRTEYYDRIRVANRLFSGGGSRGWLQDRGRVYVTLGPPDHRETYPRGITYYGLPTEIWWYGFYPITFVDERWTDDYRLVAESAAQIAVINQTQTEWNLPRERMTRPGEARFAAALPGLDIRIDKADGEKTRFTLVVPYRNIWLKSGGEMYRAVLETTMKVVDAAGAEVWSFTESFPVEIPRERLKELLAGDFTAEAAAALEPGPYTLSVVVINANDGSKASLERRFEI